MNFELTVVRDKLIYISQMTDQPEMRDAALEALSSLISFCKQHQERLHQEIRALEKQVEFDSQCG
jgi:chemotaxis regulatin CheY-phosphate phosphatase CheZ